MKSLGTPKRSYNSYGSKSRLAADQIHINVIQEHPVGSTSLPIPLSPAVFPLDTDPTHFGVLELEYSRSDSVLKTPITPWVH